MSGRTTSAKGFGQNPRMGNSTVPRMPTPARMAPPSTNGLTPVVGKLGPLSAVTAGGGGHAASSVLRDALRPTPGCWLLLRCAKRSPRSARALRAEIAIAKRRARMRALFWRMRRRGVWLAPGSAGMPMRMKGGDIA
jgi:hypothetical protein